MSAKQKVVFRLSDGGDPDVFICTPSQQFSLHSRILNTCSGWFFTASISKLWWTGTDKRDNKMYYRYMMSINNDGVSTLLPEHLAMDSAEDTSAHQGVEEISEALHNMFRSFYRQPIKVRSYTKCSILVSLANQYDALDIVSESIRASLFEWPGLDTQIKCNPEQFLLLGYRLKSERVFREAFVHVVGSFVGRHDMLRRWIKSGTIPGPLVILVSSECCRLDQLVARTMQSFLVVVAEMADPLPIVVRGVILRILGRIINASNMPGSNGILFRNIAGSSFTVNDDSIQGFDSEYSTGAISMCASVYIVPRIKRHASVLAKNNLQLKEEMPYLTCAELSEEDLPWAET